MVTTYTWIHLLSINDNFLKTDKEPRKVDLKIEQKEEIEDFHDENNILYH